MDASRLKRITILHVVGGLDATGGLMYVATELAGGAADGLRSFVWKHREFKPTLNRDLFVCRGNALRTDQSIAADVLGALKELPTLLRWIRGEENVVLHAHTRVGTISSAIASKITGCPLVVHFHYLCRYKWFYRLLLKWTGAHAVFTSTKTCRHFGFDPAQTVVMPCIPWPKKSAAAGRRRRFVAAASFVSWKNLHLIIQAFNQLNFGGKETDLVLFGRSDRPFRKEEQEQIVSLARTNLAIEVRDHDLRWMDELTANDVFVHAADQEPFGIVILEAFSRGCRCVVPSGTFLDDLPEPARSHGIWRVNPMTVSNLAQQMSAAMSSPQDAEELWRLRNAAAVGFSLENAVLKLSTVYRSMLH